MSDPRVLVLDDDYLDEIVGTLRYSFDVVGASEPAEALRLLNEAAAGEAFTVLVVDMRLGQDKEGGIRFAREAVCVNARPKFIVFTAFPDVDNADKCCELGAFGYVQKASTDCWSRLEAKIRLAHERWIWETTNPGA